MTAILSLRSLELDWFYFSQGFNSFSASKDWKNYCLSIAQQRYEKVVIVMLIVTGIAKW